MNNLKEIKSNFGFKINKCKYCDNIRILDTDKGTFVAKKNNRDKNDLFKYLQTKNFNNFLNFYDYNSDYEIYPYINEIELTDEERAIDIINLISILHNRTTFYKELDLDKIKELYEDLNNKLFYLTNYYDNLRIIFEDENYIAPSHYFLLRNISIVFRSIDDSKHFVDKWYESIKNKKNVRVVTIHNNLELNHLLKGEDTYLISWDNSSKASPIYDLLSLYKNSYQRIEFSSLFEIYNSKYPLTQEELYLLYALLLVPNKLDLQKSEIVNTKDVYLLTNYLIQTQEFVSKYNPEKANKQTD